MKARVAAVCALAALAALAGCSSGHKAKPATHTTAAPKAITMTGHVDVIGHNSMSASGAEGEECWTDGNAPTFASPTPYDDVKEGAAVVLTDAQQKVLTTTDLGAGAVVVGAEDDKTCEFSFTATDIPVGTTYGIKVGGLEMQVAHPTTAGTVTITFGDTNS